MPFLCYAITNYHYQAGHLKWEKSFEYKIASISGQAEFFQNSPKIEFSFFSFFDLGVEKNLGLIEKSLLDKMHLSSFSMHNFGTEI